MKLRFKTQNLGESSQDSHQHNIQDIALPELEDEIETTQIGNKDMQPFDHVYLWKKKVSNSKTK